MCCKDFREFVQWARRLWQFDQQSAFHSPVIFGSILNFGPTLHINIATGNDADNYFSANVVVQCRDGKRTGWLNEHAFALIEIEHGGADCVFGNGLQLRFVLLHDSKRKITDTANRDTVDKRTHVGKRHDFARDNGGVHRSRCVGLYAVDRRDGPALSKVCCDSGKQSAAANRNKHVIGEYPFLTQLFIDFVANCSLPLDDTGIVKRMDEEGA